jgi:hypothetical protein
MTITTAVHSKTGARADHPVVVAVAVAVAVAEGTLSLIQDRDRVLLLVVTGLDQVSLMMTEMMMTITITRNIRVKDVGITAVHQMT